MGGIMKVKVLRRFNDLKEKKLRDLGEVFTATKERAEELQAKGFVDIMIEIPPKPKTRKASPKRK